MNNVKIAMLSKSDRAGGGASRVAEDLVGLLRKDGFFVDHFARSSKYTKTIALYTDFEKYLYHRLKSIGLQEIIPFEKKVIKKYDDKKHYDIFHFHDLTTAISPLTLKWLSKKRRNIIWTLHDTSPVTGGCIVPLDCIKYKTTCKNCIQLNSDHLGHNFDFSFLFHKLKKHIHKVCDIHYISPSKWLADFVYDTGYLKTYPTIIPNCVDTDIFKPIDKKEARDKLQIPQNRFCIVFSAHSITSPFKGVKYAIETLRKIKELNPYIILQGNLKDKDLHLFDGLDIKKMGYIEDKKLQNLCYASADIFLNTTMWDSFSLVTLESMASGTTVVGFETGGIPEIINSNKNGFLTKERNSNILACEIKKIHKSKIYKKWNTECQKIVMQNFTQEIFLQRHIEIYKNKLKNHTM